MKPGLTPEDFEKLRELVGNPDFTRPERIVPEKHVSKPDASDPWRYVCPECNSQVRQHPESVNYQCGGCRRSFPFEKLYDKKHGQLVDPEVNKP